MRHCVPCVILALLLQFSNGELILIRKQDDVYCLESNYNNKAITWIPTVEFQKRFTYEEEVSWLPADESRLKNLKCDLMREGGCPWAEKIKDVWEIIDNASEDYGFILDHRWHSLPVYTTSGAPLELKQIPITPNAKTQQIYMSVLAKNNAFITLTDGVKGFNIKFDTYLNSPPGMRRSIAYCITDNGSPKCYNDEIIYTVGSTLKDAEEWRNVKLVIHRNETRELFITIDDDVAWHILPFAYRGRDYRIGPITNLFITTAWDQRGYWKFHNYKALRPVKPGNSLLFVVNTRRNPKLCFSILYHSGGLNKQNKTAATLRITSEYDGETSYILQAGLNWQQYRHVFNLKINTQYQLSLWSNRNYPIFAIGEMRVCNEKEFLVNKKKFNQQESNITCSSLNGTTKITWRQLAQEQSTYDCPKGSFGENCDIQCSQIVNGSCKGVKICNVDVCSCLPGYRGERCENEYHGENGNQFQNECLPCKNRMQCNGSCPNSVCEDGYYPANSSFCQDRKESCKRGTYGYNCEQNCSAFCMNPHECDSINGSCTQDKCSPEVYEPPTCEYPRFKVTEPPQVLKLGIDQIELNIPLRGITADTEIFKYIKQIALQYRLHQIHNQSTANWQERDRLPFLDLFGEQPGRITLTDLTSTSTYDVRVILYDENGNGNDGVQVPILFNVTTLSKSEENNETMNISTTILAVIILAACVSLLVIVGIVYGITRKRRATTTVDDVIYDEIDLTLAVTPPAPEPPPRVLPRDANGYLVVLEPYQYDVVREPQPLLPWLKRVRFPLRNVDREGYEVPVTRRNVAEISH